MATQPILILNQIIFKKDLVLHYCLADSPSKQLFTISTNVLEGHTNEELAIHLF